MIIDVKILDLPDKDLNLISVVKNISIVFLNKQTLPYFELQVTILLSSFFVSLLPPLSNCIRNNKAMTCLSYKRRLRSQETIDFDFYLSRSKF